MGRYGLEEFLAWVDNLKKKINIHSSNLRKYEYAKSTWINMRRGFKEHYMVIQRISIITIYNRENNFSAST